MLIIVMIITVLVVIATALPMLKHSHWIVRAMDFPRVQITALAASLLLVQVWLLDVQQLISGLLIIVTTLCLAWQLWWVLPYTVLWRKEVKTAKDVSADQQLSVITSNVLQTNRNTDALIAMVKQYQPDILVTLESDQYWQDKLQVLEDQLPYSVKCPLDNLYGMHVYSKLPFSEQKVSYLIEEGVPSIHFCLQLATGHKVRMHFVHPAPPSPTENIESTERDAELITLARSIAKTDQPVVVTGDLNDVAWSTTTRLFRKISGLLDPRVGRGMYNTFHVDYTFLRWPLDHLFHSAHFSVKHIQRLPSIGSDHFALYTVLVFDPQYGDDQQGLTADELDRVEAMRISAKKNAKIEDVPTPNT
ncbi:endonuclease/exonuclease/phosphatase family protein [Gammaproteobacteria bacterium AS21]